MHGPCRLRASSKSCPFAMSPRSSDVARRIARAYLFKPQTGLQRCSRRARHRRHSAQLVQPDRELVPNERRREVHKPPQGRRVDRRPHGRGLRRHALSGSKQPSIRGPLRSAQTAPRRPFPLCPPSLKYGAKARARHKIFLSPLRRQTYKAHLTKHTDPPLSPHNHLATRCVL